MMQILDFDWGAFAPSFTLLAAALIVVALSMGHSQASAVRAAWASLIGIAAAVLLTLMQDGHGQLFSFGARNSDGAPIALFAVDSMMRSFMLICLVSTALCILLSIGYLRQRGALRPEYYALTLLCALGMAIIAGSRDLIFIFIGIELMSLPLYILAGFQRGNASSEASMKYFLLGAFSSGFLLFGIALIFGATGSTHFNELSGASSPLFAIGLALTFVGLAFKIAAAPFHQWAPDVYDGAPTPVTAFFASAPKAAAFAALLYLFQAAVSMQAEWSTIFAVLAVASMTVGNLIALTQKNLKRMLAYSSVAHVGYALVGVAAGASESVQFYLAAYAIMSVGAFGVVSALSSKENEMSELNDYAGLGFRRPLVGIGMTLFMLSLTGLPPTAGFTGKLLLFKDAYAADLGWLVIVAALNSALSAYYYLGVVVKMYMTQPSKEAAHSPSVRHKTAAAALIAAAALVVIGGTAPKAMMNAFHISTDAAETAVQNVPSEAAP